MATTAQFDNDGSTVDIWHLDGTTSDAAKLAGANGNNLTEGAVAPTASTGQIVPTSNGAANFTSLASKYYTAGDLASMPTSDFTWEFWIEPTSFATDQRAIITKYNAAGQRSFYICTETSGAISFGVSAAGTTFVNLTSTGTLSTSGGWYYIACVFTASTRMEIFSNAVSIGSSTTSIPSGCFDGTSEIDFGTFAAFRTSTANIYNGDLDEVRLSSVARTSTELDDYYNGGGAVVVLPQPTLLTLGVG